MNKVFLVLENGDYFEGSQVSTQNSFPDKAGEVVFNTSHSGYEETRHGCYDAQQREKRCYL